MHAPICAVPGEELKKIYRCYVVSLLEKVEKPIWNVEPMEGEREIWKSKKSDSQPCLPIWITQWSESLLVVSDSATTKTIPPWNSPGQNMGVGSLPLLQGIFPIHALNPGLPHCRQILYQLSHQGSPSILERVASLFSSGSSQPRNWNRVSCITGGFFSNWATREALKSPRNLIKPPNIQAIHETN